MQKPESVAGVGTEVYAEKLGQISIEGARELRSVEIRIDLKGCDEGDQTWIGRREVPENGVRRAGAEGGGAVSEGQVKKAAEKERAVRQGEIGVDKAGHDDGSVNVVNNGVAGLRQIIDATRLPDADNSSIANEDGAIRYDSEVETSRTATGSPGPAQRKQLASAA